jgi:hypothetical protein
LKFSGQIKFPEIDHPGVPIRIVIEGSQIELVVEGESLGRWSLYDVHARRLVASAFLIDLDGTEVTFVADDPIDFAYRGVEHMAESWATIKSKRLAARSLAVRKSRKDIIPSRIEEMKEAMMANLEGRAEPRQLAGEISMPEALEADGAGESPVEEIVTAGESSEATVSEDTVSEETKWLEEEKRRLAEERAQLEEERRRADEREANRLEAYRIEMARLKAEREELQRRAEELAKGAVPDEEAVAELEPVAEAEPEPVKAEIREPAPEPGPEPEPVAEAEPDEEPETVLDEPEPEPEPEPVAEDEPDEEPETVLDEPEPEPEPEPVAEDEPDEEPEPAVVGGPPVVDLSDLETESLPDPDKEPAGAVPQPAMAGAARQRGGLMGAVRAAFRSSSREHDHQFVEAPGGIGITRYVCEECGYVSISA